MDLPPSPFNGVVTISLDYFNDSLFPSEAPFVWFFTVVRGERECETFCVLLDFKQYFRNRVTALIIFSNAI